LTGLRRAGAAECAHGGQELLNIVVSNLLNGGPRLRAAIELSDAAAAQHVTEAISLLDDMIHEIQYEVFGGRTGQT
jgi:hypothetical protein